MADLPARPTPGLPPLAPGWTEHKAPSGHMYYYNRETGKSTYMRPILEINSFNNLLAAPAVPLGPPGTFANYHPFDPLAAPTQFNPDPQQQFFQHGGHQQHNFPRGGSHHRGGHRGAHANFPDRRRQPDDRPKHRQDIPKCAPWVLVKTKLGRRFVWNRDTNESFWKFPPDVMKAVVDFDRIEREKKERRARGEPSDDEDSTMVEAEAEIAAAERDIEVEMADAEGDANMEGDDEYEEVEVTDNEGDHVESPSKRQRTEEPPEDHPLEMGEDDMAWQLAAMEGDYEDYDEEEEGLPLTEDDCKALFMELLDDVHINPYTPWDKILDDGILYDDERYKALPNMKARKECFGEWAKQKMQILKEQKAKQQKQDPRIPYLAFLHQLANPKLYWQEFRRKYKKEPEMKDPKFSDKDREKLYRDHIKRLGLTQQELKSDLSAMLKAQPLAALNRSTTLASLPPSVLTDLRFISLPASTRDPLVETYISMLPPAPEGAAESAEEEAEVAKKRAERERREKALAERERRVREEKRKQERELAFGKGRLREEEIEIERAMRVGKDGLRGQLDSFEDDRQER
ncbi:uncharacterized protein BDR25DRAFT_341885 [Lindgomyces ingoldianus]|uniref:Uncharacterized protein n=1 Tax=Lindgomyces ingoldianus TaxID=673940 RepID=A0ACB6QZP8_9PLEO|nr:uncharacterized protein BDR25DRAFT_341885 [Lindgomyces ingoldianus]KAF2472503.1 hypothetical protein BDR25DRAFT_341885 [Lindgomyces ingoldianus]